MNMPSKLGIKTFLRTLKEATGSQKVALVFHIKIEDCEGYKKWLDESEAQFDSKRLYRVKTDHVPREGMFVDEIIIDEHAYAQSALKFMSAFEERMKQVCSEFTVLAVIPKPRITFNLVKAISWLISLFKGVTDKGVPTENWKASNLAVWPDEHQMKAARKKNLDEPLFVYNLNKYKPIATYSEFDKKISGKEAYDRYAKIAGFELLRRGAYPVYGGKPISLYCSSNGCMLMDDWDHFIFVRYPQRRNLLAIIESDEFNKGEVHRDAGLERAAIFMANKA